MNREYHRWFSPSLGRDMELLVFGHSGAKVLVFPTREGRFYDYENWGMVNAVGPSIQAGHIQLFCVDSVDSESLYGYWRHPAGRIQRHGEYQAYIVNEVIPLMRWRGGSQFLIAHGCSIGAYHAANFVLRHPGMFGKLVALSGRYDLTKPCGPFADLFDGFYNQEIYFNTPAHFLPHLHDTWSLEQFRSMQVILAVGEDDPFLTSTLQLSRQLQEKGVGHEMAVWSGEAHRPRCWRRMVRIYI